MIDGDMRRPRLHSIFNLDNTKGLSGLLASKLTETEMIDFVQHHEESGLYVLPAGRIPPNPAELLGQIKFRRLMAVLDNNFTHVVIDSPPIASFTDGVLLSSVADGVLLVVHGGTASRHVVRRAKQLLSDVGAKIFGVVLNNVTVSRHDYYYYNRYHRYYYRSDEENEASTGVLSINGNGNGNGNGARMDTSDADCAGFTSREAGDSIKPGRKPQDRDRKSIQPAARATASTELFVFSISRCRRRNNLAKPTNHQICRPLRGLGQSWCLDPGAHAPGFMPSRAPRALLNPVICGYFIEPNAYRFLNPSGELGGAEVAS